MKISFRYVFFGVLLAAFLVGCVLFIRTKSRGRVPAPPVEDAARILGPVSAPVQIIEYSDFQCPACAGVQPTLRALMAAHPGKIRLVYQHFPLEGHEWSRWAHLAAECAARQNWFWPYHDRLYGFQPEWSAAKEPPIEIFMKFAKEEHLDLEIFSRCLSDPTAAEAVKEERLAGDDLRVRSTPTFFVNGEMIVGLPSKLAEKVNSLLKNENS